jgi:hypothetical protein
MSNVSLIFALFGLQSSNCSMNVPIFILYFLRGMHQM